MKDEIAHLACLLHNSVGSHVMNGAIYFSTASTQMTLSPVLICECTGNDAFEIITFIQLSLSRTDIILFWSYESK